VSTTYETNARDRNRILAILATKQASLDLADLRPDRAAERGAPGIIEVEGDSGTDFRWPARDGLQCIATRHEAPERRPSHDADDADSSYQP
jgi:hypothetical protein